MDQYPTWVGFVFIFNLIVGTGSLLLPSAFSKTGYILSTCLVIFLAFTSYLTVTFIIEVLACSNALIRWKRLQVLKREGSIHSGDDNERVIGRQNDVDAESNSTDDEERSLVNASSEDTPLTIQTNNFYTLNEKFEMGEMSKMFFSSAGAMTFFVCIAVYLFGDMSIYSAVVSSTIRDVICDKNFTNGTEGNKTAQLTMPCWDGYEITRFHAYRICQVCFTLCMAPWVFFNLSKTKHLQFLTLSFRVVAFTIMIVIATYRIINPEDPTNPPNPIKYNITTVPFLIGSLIYAFMSQHSLPSILVPIKDKHKIFRIITIDYVVITALYLILALTGIFAFMKLEDLYTINFIPKDGSQELIIFKIIEYFLALFPVLTLTTTFPIVAITLRNNLQTLFVEKSQIEAQNFFVRRMLFPLMAIVPPFIITFNTENVESLVSFTGCFAGNFIQYGFPIALVYFARKTCRNVLGRGVVNDFKSPFQSNFWIFMLLTWACVSLTLVSIKLYMEIFHETNNNDDF